MRLLFFIAHTRISGGNRIIFELINRLSCIDFDVEVLFYYEPGQIPNWYPFNSVSIEPTDYSELITNAYDYIVFAQAFLIPVGLPYIGRACPVYLSQAYESFCYGNTLSELLTESPALASVFRLPIPVIAVSESLKQNFLHRVGRDAFLLPLAIDKDLFYERPAPQQTFPKRILMVGNYLEPVKGMEVGFHAIELLASDIPVQLVLLTQETTDRERLLKHSFPVEIHFAPPQATIPDIYASCHVYCCSSHYEAFSLPGLEAMACGVPVVSTRNGGVSNYGYHQQNLLLTEPGDSKEMALRLRQILQDDSLAQTFREQGFKTAQQYDDWDRTVCRFVEILDQIPLQHPGVFTVEEMSPYVKDLETEGVFTPHSVILAYHSLHQQLCLWQEEVAQSKKRTPAALEKLQLIHDNLETYVIYKQAQYYTLFKECYDQCRFLLTLEEESYFFQALDVMLRHRYVSN